MTTTPIRREFLDAEGTSRLAEEVPAGAISASFRDLMGRRRASDKDKHNYQTDFQGR